MKQYSFKEFCKLVKKNGYELSRISGSHHIFKKDGSTIVVNKDLNRMVCQRLIKENCLVAA